MAMISALIKRPGERPRHVNVSNTLEALQKSVDGYIETFAVDSDLVIVCNEESRIRGLPYNCTICDCDFVGTILMVGVSGEEFTDLPLTWADMKKLFPNLWEATA